MCHEQLLPRRFRQVRGVAVRLATYSTALVIVYSLVARFHRLNFERARHGHPAQDDVADPTAGELRRMAL